MKKTVALGMAALMVIGLAGCSTDSNSQSGCNGGSSEAQQHIYVLTAPEDHGWSGSVATFAKEKIDEVN